MGPSFRWVPCDGHQKKSSSDAHRVGGVLHPWFRRALRVTYIPLKSPVGLGHPPFRWVRSDGLLQVPKTAPPPLLSKGRDGPYSVTFDVCCCIALGFAKAGTTWFFTVEFFIGFFLNNPIIWGPAKSSFIQFYYKQIEIIGSRAQCPLMVVLEYVWWQLE